ASGLERLLSWSRTAHVPESAPRLVAAAPIAATVCALLTFVPVYGASLRASADVTLMPYDLVERQGLDRALVFVHSLPAQHLAPGSWAYYHRNNSPDLTDPVLFVRFLGPERNSELIRRFPDRAPYAMGMQGDRLVLVPIAR